MVLQILMAVVFSAVVELSFFLPELLEADVVFSDELSELLS